MTKRLSFMASVFLASFGVISSAWGWEPSEPEGVTPLNAEQIKAAFAGHVFKGKNIDYVDQHFKDGRLKGEFSGGHDYSGKWWVEERDEYLCQKVKGKNHCYNIARGKDGYIYYYLWGSDHPDVWGSLSLSKIRTDTKCAQLPGAEMLRCMRQETTATYYLPNISCVSLTNF